MRIMQQVLQDDGVLRRVKLSTKPVFSEHGLDGRAGTDGLLGSAGRVGIEGGVFADGHVGRDGIDGRRH